MKIDSDYEPRWRDLFEKQQPALEEAAHMLLCRQEDPKEILSSAVNQLKNRPFHEVFGPTSALREVIKAAIARNDSSIEQDFEQPASFAGQRRRSGPLPLEALPWAERAAYFLREVLLYKRRDAALLLGISDAEVDHLARSAKHRMGQSEDPAERLLHRYTTPSASIRARHSIAFAAFE